MIDTLPFGQDPEAAAALLETAIADVAAAVSDMRAGAKEADHYEL